ncbi:MAG: hypothetical protein ACO3YY_08570 [Phycisphaerales bacterium]
MTKSRHIDVLGTIWHTDRHERTSLGRLVEAAKDRDDSAARARIVDEIHAWVVGGGLMVEPDAIVVGSAIKIDGDWRRTIDLDRATRFVAAART